MATPVIAGLSIAAAAPFDAQGLARRATPPRCRRTPARQTLLLRGLRPPEPVAGKVRRRQAASDPRPPPAPAEFARVQACYATEHARHARCCPLA